MPIDGIHIKLPINNFEDYKQAVPSLVWGSTVNEDTGELIPEQTKKQGKRQREDAKGRYKYTTITRTAIYKELELKVKEIHRQFNSGYTGMPGQYILEITGSLHKNHYGHNYGKFTFSDLRAQLTELEQVLKIPLHLAEIKTIETGINITPAIPAHAITNNIHGYKDKSFYYYKPKQLGGYFSMDRYEIKIYNKGVKHSLPFELLRFELHYNKMAIINSYGIKTLSDLTNKEKVMRLQGELLKAWQEVVLFDIYAESNPGITGKDKEFLNEVMRRDYWETLRRTVSRKTCLKKKEQLRAISANYGKDIHREIEKLIIVEWQNLFKKVTFAPGGKTNATKTEGNVCTIKIKEANVTPLNKRYCLSCGKDISHQRKNSKYCSETLNGKEGKKCRNNNSNPVHNRKRKIQQLEGKGLLFDVVPYLRSIHKVS